MDTGAPATETGQRRRISLMILLMLGLLIATLIYFVLDGTRAADAKKRQVETDADRGATIFARTCSICHGVRGQGLIGPTLNKDANRPSDPATLDQLVALYTNTITCG